MNDFACMSTRGGIPDTPINVAFPRIDKSHKAMASYAVPDIFSV